MPVRSTSYLVERKYCTIDCSLEILSTFGKLLQMEHVLFERVGLHRIHAFSETKVGAFDFSSPCCDDES